MKGDDVGIVVIGRNEGQRLRNCLQSISDVGVRVYVDSGSTDGSQSFARSLGFIVLDLDPSQEFTAARARNLGISYIASNHPEVRFVQTVDGDCEVVTGWAERARQELEGQSELAVVFGRRRERFPAKNIYHRACEIEWNVPRGKAKSCGGDALFRLQPLTDVQGYNPRLISWEEPDLCYRLRRAGWGILSDGRDMTLHDVDISSFRQWWRRALRAGHGIAELVAIHGLGADDGWRRFLLSAAFWTGFLALSFILLIGGLMITNLGVAALGAGMLAIVLAQITRITMQTRRNPECRDVSLVWGALTFVSKVAQTQGALLYLRRRLTSSRKAIIEYK